MSPPVRPTTPSKSSLLIKGDTRCVLQKTVEVKVVESDVAKYPEQKNKVYTLAKNSEVVTRGDPTPAVMTGSTEPLSVDNASYRFVGKMDLAVYESTAEDEISFRTNLLCHSNLRPLNSHINVSTPLKFGTIVSVKQPVLDSKNNKVVSPGELLRITSKHAYSPRAGMIIGEKSSLSLSTASYSAEKVVRANHSVEVFNPVRIMHKDLMKVD